MRLFLSILGIQTGLALGLDGWNENYLLRSNQTRAVIEWAWPQPQSFSGVYQANGSADFVLANAPAWYEWDSSEDGTNWTRLTAVTNEVRLHRSHRFATKARLLRLSFPTAARFREVRFFNEPGLPSLAPWVLLINSTHDRSLPGHGQEFLPLIRSTPGWEKTPAQQIWVGDCIRAFVEIEPKPVALFFSGSFKDWCEVDRDTWSGVEDILKNAPLPIWASCGGAQALAILAETGAARPWDCPHCRDPKNPKLPIYTHIGHTGVAPCGDYSQCIFERGPHQVEAINGDAVFAGLPARFSVMESHCGQIEWVPAGWELVAAAGPGTKTKNQCLKRTDLPVYAAQFHIEMEGTPESSRAIISNFLKLAANWRRTE